MSPSNELRAARLRELCQSLVSDGAKVRFGQLFHAAIRSDDAALQSLMDEDCGENVLIPPLVGQWVHDDEEDWEESFSFSELLAQSNSERSNVTNNGSTDADARAFRQRLWEIVWQTDGPPYCLDASSTTGPMEDSGRSSAVSERFPAGRLGLALQELVSIGAAGRLAGVERCGWR